MTAIILISIGVSAFLSMMLWTVILPFKPDTLKIFGKFVCQNDEKIEILTSVASYHQPGERSIEIYCNDYGKRRSVKGKVLLLSFLSGFLITLPLSFLIVFYIFKQFNL
jgi:hypothetical protein